MRSFRSLCFFKDNKTAPPIQNATQLRTPPKQPSAPQGETIRGNKTDYTTSCTSDYQSRKSNKRHLHRHEGNFKVCDGLVPVESHKSKQISAMLAKNNGHSDKVTGYKLDFSTTGDQPRDSWFASWSGRGHLLPGEILEDVKALTMKVHSQFQEVNPTPKASEEKGVTSAQDAEKGKMAIQAPQEDSRKTAPQPGPAIQTNHEVSGGKLQSAKNQSSNNQPPPDKNMVSVSISLHQSFAE